MLLLLVVIRKNCHDVKFPYTAGTKEELRLKIIEERKGILFFRIIELSPTCLLYENISTYGSAAPCWPLVPPKR